MEKYEITVSCSQKDLIQILKEQGYSLVDETKHIYVEGESRTVLEIQGSGEKTQIILDKETMRTVLEPSEISALMNGSFEPCDAERLPENRTNQTFCSGDLEGEANEVCQMLERRKISYQVTRPNK